MHLIIFDIDGTLTETIKIDEECFVRSFKDVFGFADIDTDCGTGSRATRLFAEGAVYVFPDFSDADTFLKSVYEITSAA